MCGRMPVVTSILLSAINSSRVPIVEPCTRSGLKKILVSSALPGLSPDVVPQITSVPPGFNALIECDQVAAPTVSITASTRSGSRAPIGKA